MKIESKVVLITQSRWLIAASALCLILTLGVEAGSHWPEAPLRFIAQQQQQDYFCLHTNHYSTIQEQSAKIN